MPHELWSFPLWLVGLDTIFNLMFTSQSFQVNLTLSSGSFLTWILWSLLTSILERCSLRPLEFSLYVALFFVVLPCILYSIWLTHSPASSQLRKTTELYWVPLLALPHGNSLKAWAILGLISFVFHVWEITFIAKCLENYCFMYFVRFLRCFKRENKLDSCSSILFVSRNPGHLPVSWVLKRFAKT